MTTTSRIATAATALAIGAVAVTGTAIAAPEASAAVPSGNFTLRTTTVGIVSVPSNATIRGNTLTVTTPVRQVYRLHPTRSGAWFQTGSVKYTLVKRGKSLSGPATVGPVTIGDVRMTPRR